MDKAKALGLEELVTFKGKSLYLDSLAAARAADLLLLIDAPAEHSVFLPSKIVDYLMLGRPILGLTPASGASAAVLRRLGFPIASPDNATAIEKALRQAFDAWRQGRPATAIPEPAQFEGFDIRNVAQQFENALIGRKA